MLVLSTLIQQQQNIYVTTIKSTLLLRISAPPDAAALVCSFAFYQLRAEKCRLVTYLHFASHACFGYDVTDTDRCAQNGSTHGRAFAAFECRFAANRTKNRVKYKQTNEQTKTGPMMLFPSCSLLSAMLYLF